jgi:hypothetical protein
MIAILGLDPGQCKLLEFRLQAVHYGFAKAHKNRLKMGLQQDKSRVLSRCH